ncbi:MAG TPA: ABC transporter permease [Acidimicrobiales bacterium]|nr:ABC transporter permease [Acidimicrobiales bacterium]
MHAFLEYTVIGIVLGAAYAVAASGLVVTYSTSGIFNIAHGAIGMFMAFVYWQLSVGWHVNQALSLVLTVFVLAPLLGALIERTVIQWMDPNNVATCLAVTVGLTLLFFGLVNNYIWKPTARSVPQFFGFNGFTLFGVHIDYEEVITVGAAIAIAVLLRLFLYRTRTGIAMRGVVDNRPLVGLFGGRAWQLSTLSWSIGASLASVAGILVAPRLQLQPLILTLLVIDAYAAAVFGRLRSLPMTFLGGLIVGLASSYAQGYVPNSGAFWASAPVQGLLTQSVPSILLFVFILALPAHRLRTGAAQRHAPLAPASFLRSVQGSVLLVAAVIVATAFMDPGNVIKLGIGLAFALICLSLVPLTGYGGFISICQLSFAGLGAFAMYKWGAGGSFWGILAAAGLAGGVGALLAWPTLRVRGLYLALLTMAFATAMDNAIFPWSAIFGFNGSAAIPKPSIFGLHMTSPRSFTIFLAVVFAVFSMGILALRRGPFGRVLVGMKDSEAACATLGLSLRTTKLGVFMLSAAMAGVAGALYGAASSVATGTDFEMFESLLILAVVAIGGASVCSGALAGGLALGFLPANAQDVFIGAGTIVLAFYSEGILPLIYSRFNGWWSGLVAPRDPTVPIGGEERAGALAGSRAA